MPAEYMHEERRDCALERTPNKIEQKQPSEQWSLSRFMACQPRTYSPFLYNCSLVAHMLTVFKTRTMNIKTTHRNGQMQL